MNTCIICKQAKKCNSILGHNFCQNCKASYYIYSTNFLQEHFKDVSFKQLSVDSLVKETVEKIYQFLVTAKFCSSRLSFKDFKTCPSNKSCRFCKYRVSLMALKKFPKINKVSMENMKPLISLLNQNRELIFKKLEALFSTNKIGDKVLKDNRSISIVKTNQVFRMIHEEKPMHKYLRNNIDMDINVYEIRSGGCDVKIENKPKGFEKVQKLSSSFDGSKYSLNSNCQYAEFSLASNDMKMTMSNSVHFCVNFLKKICLDTAQIYFNSERLAQIRTDLEKLFTMIFEEYQMLPGFCRLMASEDETMRWRYENRFAINNQSLYVYGVHQFGLEKGTIHYNDCRKIGAKLKGLDFYPLALITIYAMVEVIKQHQRLDINKDVVMLLNLISANLNYLLTANKFNEHSTKLVYIINNYYSAYVKNFYNIFF